MRTAFIMLLDRSGSMASIKSDIVGGLNSLIKEQKSLDDKSTDIFFMAQFDHEYSVLREWTSIVSLTEFSEDSFIPRGTTALYDSMGKTIDECGNYFASLPADQRPDKVLFVTLTDGFENASRTFKKSDIAAKIKHQTDVYKWDFSFIGANFDVFAEGNDLNISKLNTYSYDTSSKESISKMTASLSVGVSAYRSTAARSIFTADTQAK
jgi:hypothetical protein